MKALILRPVLAAMAFGLSVAAGADLAKLPPVATGRIGFEKDVAPILENACVGCHGPKRAENGLRLDTADGARKGGDHGPAFVAGKSEGSLLVQVTAGIHAELAQMPKKGDKLTSAQIGTLRAWIDQGADWPATAKVDKAAHHWAFKAPVRPEVPGARDVGRGTRDPIDAFIAARLAREGLKIAPPADKTTLLRRVHLDLVGLPPTQQWATASAPTAAASR